MIRDPQFDDVRPYYDEEIPAAMERIASHPAFPKIAQFVFPELSVEAAAAQLRSFQTIYEFQHVAMKALNEQVIAKTTSGLTYEGGEYLDPSKRYLFVSNHRDIVLDACLQQYILYLLGHDSSEITFGANLMQGQLVIDIGNSNKMFKVDRPDTAAGPREFYRSALHNSAYIRYAITQKEQSVWIAQRNGRTKDGIDRTDQGIVKMFGMSYPQDKVEALAQLNIAPVSVSYEWESCDILKALELYARQGGKPYVKQPGEDLNSMVTGIMQPKGRVHIHLCRPLQREELEALRDCPSAEYHKRVAELIDSRILPAFRLWPNNYIAHDMLEGSRRFADRYTEAEYRAFAGRVESLRRYEACEFGRLREIFLGIYANPLNH